MLKTTLGPRKDNMTEKPKEDHQINEISKDTVAKAGKRSAKALAEAEEKAKKSIKKITTAEQETPKKVAPKTRSKVERRGKAYKASYALIDKTKIYTLTEAIELAQKTSKTKFDATVELHIKLGVDPRQADQNIRGTVTLPKGSGKKVRVAAFVDADNVQSAKTAGADIAAGEELLQDIDKGLIDFDTLITSPALMPKLGKYAKVLGPKGLMPNPKSGTVAKNITAAIKEAKAGKIEYRVDSTGIIHLGIGKVSFKKEDLLVNAKTVISAIKAAKPASIKGSYVQTLYATSSMGPSIQVSPSDIE